MTKKMIDEYAKRTKSKFNTLKRSYFKSKKQPIPDFPLFIFTESEKMIRDNKTKLADRLQKAM